MEIANKERRALEPPLGDVVPLTGEMVSRAAQASHESARGRIVQPLHKSPNDPLQRMLNAIQPGSYIQPHRHLLPPKAETLIVLRGSIGYVTFREDGSAQDYFVVSARGERNGMDTQSGVYHTFFALEEDTVVFEVKPGPYTEASDKDFAAWAPKEGSAEASAYLESLTYLKETP